MELSKYKICPACGKHNPPRLLECRYCEADLTGIRVVDGSAEKSASTIPAPALSEAEGAELVRICECGAENAPQARKCSVCGEDISDIIPVQVKKKAKKSFSYQLNSVDGSFSITIDKPFIVVGRDAELKEYLRKKEEKTDE